MTIIYLVGIGHNVALLDLDPIEPQPATVPPRATERTYGLSGAVHDHGDYAELVWSALADAEEYQDLLEQFDLDVSLTSEVTVYMRNWQFEAGRYNATAVRPQLGADGDWSQFFPRNVVILLKNLESSV